MKACFTRPQDTESLAKVGFGHVCVVRVTSSFYLEVSKLIKGVEDPKEEKTED